LNLTHHLPFVLRGGNHVIVAQTTKRGHKEGELTSRLGSLENFDHCQVFFITLLELLLVLVEKDTMHKEVGFKSINIGDINSESSAC